MSPALSPEELSDPSVRAVVIAVRDGDRDAFYGAFADHAELTDDGALQDLRAWAEREVFGAHGRIEVEEERQHGRYVLGRFRSDQWDFPKTFWHFQISEGRITRLDVGQG
ncbi:nuclear transport factor 2 family protein [Streptomyces sp. I05A-00742]|uniref:nuclear transport factor 2 family protein n=1 Tax=Streptomyces sp. I05A-00742 TaxID=2732853 RepID=UPI001BB28FC2|nr:nuclear transport factor 2 family protein [Streptomyces sp. I05A-00742]